MGADDTEMACCPPLIVAGPRNTSAVGGPPITTNRIFCLQCIEKRSATAAVATNIDERDTKRYDKTSDF